MSERDGLHTQTMMIEITPDGHFRQLSPNDMADVSTNLCVQSILLRENEVRATLNGRQGNSEAAARLEQVLDCSLDDPLKVRNRLASAHERAGVSALVQYDSDGRLHVRPEAVRPQIDR